MVIFSRHRGMSPVVEYPDSPSHLRNFVETAPTLRSYGQIAQGSGAFDLPIRKLSYEQFVLGSALAEFVIWPYESGSPSRRNFVDSWDCLCPRLKHSLNTP